jgi:hypothetical protein
METVPKVPGVPTVLANLELKAVQNVQVVQAV